MGRKHKDHTDRVYGRLTMLSYARSGGGGVGAIWMASCSCGNILEVVAKDCQAGKRTSCGMCGKGLGLVGAAGIPASGVPKGHRRAFRALVRKARDLEGGVQFNVQDYLRVVKNRCVACNVRGTVAEWGDPKGPGDPTNLIPICVTCSTHRRGLNVVKWLEFIMRISNVITRKWSNGGKDLD